ncbi:MAG: hypothetical protein P8103_13020 [Candidatus Thiodiazotropha sp.]|jgi:hypothetical protein
MTAKYGGSGVVVGDDTYDLKSTERPSSGEAARKRRRRLWRIVIWHYHKPALSTQRVHIAYQYAAAKSNVPAKKYTLKMPSTRLAAANSAHAASNPIAALREPIPSSPNFTQYGALFHFDADLLIIFFHITARINGGAIETSDDQRECI